MAPITTHHFSLPFYPPCQLHPDQVNQNMLPLSNRLKAIPTLISLRAGLKKLDILYLAIFVLAVPEIFACTFKCSVYASETDVGTGHSILAILPAFIQYLFCAMFPNSFEIWYIQPMRSPNLCNSPSKAITSLIQEGFLRCWGSNSFFAFINFRIFYDYKML
jgi:hypothetical protein